MSFLTWLMQPVVDSINYVIGNNEKEPKVPIPTQEEQDEKELIEHWNSLVDKTFPTQPLAKTTSTKSKTIFRPTEFNQYIGQEHAKTLLKNYIKGTGKREVIFPHTLIHGSAGYGKTTLAKILAHQLKVTLVETITSDITDFSCLQSLIESCNGGILFLDEIHSIDRNNAEKLYSIMEDFSYSGQEINPFTLIGATTELGEILRNRRPFYDRFKIILGLAEYNTEELTAIIKQYNQKMFEKEKLDNGVLRKIAGNSRSTPRTAIRLLEATIYFDGDIDKVLKCFNIIQSGYTKTDLQLLKYMNQNPNGIGLQGIATYLDTSKDNYLYETEPYLLKNGLIIRTPRGRKISEKGINTINILKGENK